jgi:hypothetical protein
MLVNPLLTGRVNWNYKILYMENGDIIIACLIILVTFLIV